MRKRNRQVELVQHGARALDAPERARDRTDTGKCRQEAVTGEGLGDIVGLRRSMTSREAVESRVWLACIKAACSMAIVRSIAEDHAALLQLHSSRAER